MQIARLASKGARQGLTHVTATKLAPLDDVPCLFSNERMATGHQFDLPYMVEQWDDADSYVEELIALTGDYRERHTRKP